ncbi:MAG: hypothetical protein EAZ97_02980 [Bacteroidetes bacterium]|nr:MAG: hypothetical protein EAZ97_02980 [Bacteroidota bacterium]
MYLKKHRDKNGNGKNGNGKPQLIDMPEDWGTTIKWSRDLKAKFLRNDLSKNKLLKFNKKKIVKIFYRPFVQQFYYADKTLSDVLTQNHYNTFGIDLGKGNKVISFTSPNSQKPFMAIIVDSIMDLHFTSSATNAFFTSLYRYENGEKVENISDWALELFREKYESVEGGGLSVEGGGVSVEGGGVSFEDTTLETPSSTLETRISKLDIFHYVYAVLHHPDYRKTYEIDLKRDFPRIPLYADFWKYAKAGEKLMSLHLNYEDRGLSVEGDLSMESRGLSVGNLSMENRGSSVGDLSMENRGSSVGDSRVENRGSSVGETSLETPSSKLNPPSSKLDTLKVIRKPLESLLPKQRTEDLAQKAEILSKIVPQIKLKVNKDREIELDELTKISGIPPEVWEYKLGNRSAVEWILDQYKPYKSGDASIQAHFNNYNFADYQEEVIDLLLKVIVVSTETMRIVKTL